MVCPEQAIVAGDAAGSEVAPRRHDPGSADLADARSRRAPSRTPRVVRRTPSTSKPSLPELGTSERPPTYIWSRPSARTSRSRGPTVIPGMEPPTGSPGFARRGAQAPAWGWDVAGPISSPRTSRPAPRWWRPSSPSSGDCRRASRATSLPEVVGPGRSSLVTLVPARRRSRAGRSCFLKLLFASQPEVLAGEGRLGADRLRRSWSPTALVARLAGARWRPPTCCGGSVCPWALMTSGYSAFLFAQCKGRDLWQSRRGSSSSWPHLLGQACSVPEWRCCCPVANFVMGQRRSDRLCSRLKWPACEPGRAQLASTRRTTRAKRPPSLPIMKREGSVPRGALLGAMSRRSSACSSAAFLVPRAEGREVGRPGAISLRGGRLRRGAAGHPTSTSSPVIVRAGQLPAELMRHPWHDSEDGPLGLSPGQVARAFVPVRRRSAGTTGTEYDAKAWPQARSRSRYRPGANHLLQL